MFQDACQPDVGKTQVFYRVKGGFVNVVKGTASVFGLAAIDTEVGLLVAKQSGEKWEAPTRPSK